MAWQVRRKYHDDQTGQHIVELHDPETKAEHVLQVVVSHDACPLCGHVRPKDNLGEIDLAAIIRNEIQNLESARKQAHEHARKHNLEIRKAK